MMQSILLPSTLGTPELFLLATDVVWRMVWVTAGHPRAKAVPLLL